MLLIDSLKCVFSTVITTSVSFTSRDRDYFPTKGLSKDEFERYREQDIRVMKIQNLFFYLDLSTENNCCYHKTLPIL